MLQTLRFQGDPPSTDKRLTAPLPAGEAARKSLIETRRVMAERYPDLLEDASPYSNRLPSTSLPQEQRLPLIQEEPEAQLPHITLTTEEGEEQPAVIRYSTRPMRTRHANLYTPLLDDQFRSRRRRPGSHNPNALRQTEKTALGILGGIVMSLSGTALMIRSSMAEQPDSAPSDLSPLGMTLVMTGFLLSFAAMGHQVLKKDREEGEFIRHRRMDSRV